MTSLPRWLLVVVVVGLVPLGAGAESTATPAEIARLIRRLGSTDFDEREAAVKALEAIGPAALDALDVATADKDPEVRRRADSLLETIEQSLYGRPMSWNGKRLADWRHLLASKKADDRIAATRALGHMAPAADRIVRALLPVVKEDADVAVRLEAIRAVAGFGPRALPALDGLKSALRDGDKKVRLAVAEAFWTIDVRADLAVPALAELLADEDLAFRQQVADMLGRMAPFAREAMPALTKSLGEPDLPTRQALAATLWRIDRQNEAAQGVFLDIYAKDEDQFRRGESLRYLARSIPLRNKLTAHFLGVLTDDKPANRMIAPRALRGLDELSPEEVRALLKSLGDSDAWTRAGAAQTLGELGPRTPEVLRALAKTLVEDTTAQPRQSALRALLQMGPAAREVLPAILKAIKDPHIRSEALVVIGRLGNDAKDGVPALIEALADRFLRGPAAIALGQIGPAATPAIPALIDCFDDPSTITHTTEALARIGPAAIEPLLKGLANKNAQVSMQSANTLGKFGAKPVAALAKIVAEGNRSASWLAAHALSLIGPDAKDARPELLAALKVDNPALRRAATRALCRIDPLHAEVFPVLVKLIDDADISNRFEVIRSLGELGPRARDALPALTAVLKDGPATLQFPSAEAIARIDPRSPLPLPVFQEALKSPDPFPRAEAWRTLGRLGQWSERVLGQVAEGLGDKEVFVRQEAYGVLVGVLPLVKEVPAEVILACERALWGRNLMPVGDSHIRLAQIIGRMGARARPLLGVLTYALNLPDRTIRPAVAHALWQIDRSPLVIPALVEVLAETRDSAARTAAANALAEIGPPARTAIPVLLLACQATGGNDTADLIVRPAALRALWKIEPKTQAWVLPILLESLRDGSYAEARVQTLQTLGEMGPAARLALPAVQRATRAYEEPIRVAAAEAVRRIEAKSE
jgi:HEAT repeat protein